MDINEQKAHDLVAQMTVPEVISQLRYDAPAIERLGIPAYNWWNEGLHGVARAGAATVFPQAIAMAAGFNDDLVYRVATAISDEARAKYNEYRKFGETDLYQGLTYWSPNINIFRDPRWGRGHETYGEDPYLTGRMGSAFVRGLQGEGDGVKYRKLDATLKHYAVHSGPESLRHGFNAIVNEYDLKNTYLRAFQYCIEKAHPAAVMGAYNRVNGEACCASELLLQKILRQEYGFDGYVVSDCGAICDISDHHGLAANKAEAAALAVNHGCELNCGSAYQFLVSAFALGLVKEETLREAAVKLFRSRFELGMFDDDCEYNKIGYDVLYSTEHRELNREIARESIVLLKNNGILPLDPKSSKKIAVIGPNADNLVALLANYNGTPTKAYTVLRGIEEYTDPLYAPGCDLFADQKESMAAWGDKQYLKDAVSVARNADVVILCMGITAQLEGEESDNYSAIFFNGGDRESLEYPDCQKRLYHEIMKIGKPVIFVNISGSCMNLSVPKAECDAIVQCFYPGEMGGLALADILFGVESPSGRLPVTFYQTADDLPPFEDYAMSGRTYRYFQGTPVYEFGYGLTYSDIREKWIDRNTVEVANIGEVDTKYTVLKYSMVPEKTLVGFKKIYLKKGEVRRLTILDNE